MDKYLDYVGLKHLIDNYIINKSLGVSIGDILYVDSINDNIPTYSRLPIGNQGDFLTVNDKKPFWTSITPGGYEAGTGLTLNDNIFNHKNSVTAKSSQGLYPFTYDSEGHITGSGNAITRLPNPGVLSFYNYQASALSNTYNGSVAFGIFFSSKFTVTNESAEDGGVKIDFSESYVRYDTDSQGLNNTQKENARNNIDAQEILSSGVNIKTINNNSILGSGNINISGSGITSRYIGILIFDDDESPDIWFDDLVENFTDGVYVVIPTEYNHGGTTVYSSYWQGCITYLENGTGGFSMTKTISSGDNAYIQFTYSGSSITIINGSTAADFGAFYIFKLIGFLPE